MAGCATGGVIGLRGQSVMMSSLYHKTGLDTIYSIRESVDSLCRDDVDMPMTPYIRKACNRPNAAFVSLFR